MKYNKNKEKEGHYDENGGISLANQCKMSERSHYLQKQIH